MEKDKKITEDDLKRAEKDIQDVTNALTAKIDEVFSHKEKEVMEV
jgi:ribosome recycling factor